MTRDEIKAEIQRRTETMPEFSWMDLWVGLPLEAGRIADAYLQQLRKSGKASFERRNGRPVWSMKKETK